MAGLESHITNFINGLYTHYGYIGIIIAMAIESCCIPLPSEIIMPLAGYFVFKGTFSLPGITLAGAFGCLVGSLVAYAIGATGGRPLLLKYGRYILVSAHDAEVADRFFARYGEGTIFATRLMPIVRTFISLPAGISRMNLLRFSIFTFLGSLPWTLALGYAGIQLGANWTKAGGFIRRYDVFVAVVFVVLVVLYIYRHVRSTATSSRSA